MTGAVASARLAFLRSLQNLLEEGDFVSTYKFALLHALADIAVEGPPVGEAELEVPTRKIAVKFIEYYWRQVRPFGVNDSVGMLLQNAGRQAAVLNRIESVQSSVGGKLGKARASGAMWESLVKDVRDIVCRMPLWKLQNRGIGGRHEFIYAHIDGEGLVDSIVLKPSVAACFRELHGLIINMVRGAWVHKVQSIGANQALLGNDSQLLSFLFGSERADLSPFVPVLHDHQAGRCFYCERPFTGRRDVDHFVPWSRYPVDLANNFVLACAPCNNKKSDHLAATVHLQRWYEANIRDGEALESAYVDAGVSVMPEVSLQVTRWAYENGQTSRTLMWRAPNELLYFDSNWRDVLPPDEVE